MKNIILVYIRIPHGNLSQKKILHCLSSQLPTLNITIFDMKLKFFGCHINTSLYRFEHRNAPGQPRTTRNNS